MRFFQPIQQSGYARILAETRTHFPFSPGLLFGGIEAFIFQNPPDGAAGKADSQAKQLSLDSSGSPKGIFMLESEDEGSKLRRDGFSSQLR